MSHELNSKYVLLLALIGCPMGLWAEAAPPEPKPDPTMCYRTNTCAAGALVPPSPLFPGAFQRCRPVPEFKDTINTVDGGVDPPDVNRNFPKNASLRCGVGEYQDANGHFHLIVDATGHLTFCGHYVRGDICDHKL